MRISFRPGSATAVRVSRVAVASVLMVVVVAVMMAPFTAAAAVLVVRVRVDDHLAVLSVDLALEAGGPEAGLSVARPHVLPEINSVMVSYFLAMLVAVAGKRDKYF